MQEGDIMSRFGLLTLSFCSIFCGPALAWNSYGHMEVAAVAWERLAPEVSARATELLRRNPMSDFLFSGGSETDSGRIAFIRAATWPDLIKEASGYISDGPSGGNRPPNTPQASQNIGYTDHFRHKYWHFIGQALFA
jgi:hypothetical protein